MKQLKTVKQIINTCVKYNFTDHVKFWAIEQLLSADVLEGLVSVYYDADYNRICIN